MIQKLDKSIILTGPSASGKSTLHCCLTLHFKLVPIPIHTTRPIRPGEIHGVEIFHISKSVYFENFEKGLYLEEYRESGFFGGAYYGTPKRWVSETEAGRFNCFVCPTVSIARLIKKKLGGKIFWIHLTASQQVRQHRISKRNPEMPKEQVDVRISRGSEKIDISGHDYCIDTSHLGARSIFEHTIQHIQLDDGNNYANLCAD